MMRYFASKQRAAILGHGLGAGCLCLAIATPALSQALGPATTIQRVSQATTPVNRDRSGNGPQAQPQPTNNSQPSRWFRLPDWLTRPFRDRSPANTTPFRPTGKGAPSSTSVGGSRNDLRCPGDPEPVRILMPEQNEGLTQNGRPALFLALRTTQAQEVMISFENVASGNLASGNATRSYFELARYPLRINEGVAAFRLDAAAPALQPGVTYRWFLSVICGEQPSPNDPLFSGLVRRQSLTAAAQEALEGRSLQAQAQWYAEQGYWYDALALLEQYPQLVLGTGE